MLIRSREAPDGPPIAIYFPLEDLRGRLLDLFTRDPLAPGVREALFVVEQGQRWNATHEGYDRMHRNTPIARDDRDTRGGFIAYNTSDFLHEFGRREDLPAEVREVVRLVAREDSDLRAPQPGIRFQDPQTLAPFTKPPARAEIREVPKP